MVVAEAVFLPTALPFLAGAIVSWRLLCSLGWLCPECIVHWRMLDCDFCAQWFLGHTVFYVTFVSSLGAAIASLGSFGCLVLLPSGW